MVRKSKPTSKEKSSDKHLRNTFSVCETDNGSQKIQWRGEIDSQQFIQEIKKLLSREKFGKLRWPTLYFGKTKNEAPIMQRELIDTYKTSPQLDPEKPPWED
jgi:hypothetical protein